MNCRSLWNVSVCSFQYVKNDKETNKYDHWPELLSLEGCLSPTTVWAPGLFLTCSEKVKVLMTKLPKKRAFSMNLIGRNREEVEHLATCVERGNVLHLLLPWQNFNMLQMLFLPSFCTCFHGLPDSFKGDTRWIWTSCIYNGRAMLWFLWSRRDKSVWAPFKIIKIQCLVTATWSKAQ